jgi:hypothetical protein
MTKLIAIMCTLVVFATPVAAQQQNAPVPYKDKDGGTAALISVLITGGGQIYTGETGRGLTMLGISIAAPVAGVLATAATCEQRGYVEDCNWTPFIAGIAVSLATKVYSVIDASPSAKRMNERNGAARAALPVKVQPTVGVASQGGTELGFKVVLRR